MTTGSSYQQQVVVESNNIESQNSGSARLSSVTALVITTLTMRLQQFMDLYMGSDLCGFKISKLYRILQNKGGYLWIKAKLG